MQTRYFTVAEVVAIHRRTIGAMVLLRSEALLESAIQRCQSVAYYGGADLVEQAVLLAVDISQNQPFLDRNKRTALYALVAFLQMNGVRYVDDRLELARQLIAMAEREGSLDTATERFVGWLRARVVDIPQDER